MQHPDRKWSNKKGAKARVAQPAKTVSKQALEQRLLLDAAGASTFADLAADDVGRAQSDLAIDALNKPALTGFAQERSIPPREHSSPQQESSRTVIGEAALAIFSDTAADGSAMDRSVLYVLDSNVENLQQLVSGLPDDAEIVYIDSAIDGVEQLAQVLEIFNV